MKIQRYTDPHDRFRTVRMRAVHREQGDVPGSIPALPDPTLLQVLNIPKRWSFDAWAKGMRMDVEAARRQREGT